MSNVNICIIHYNTPKVTECLIKSINKFVPRCHIYIFDNSDKYPFTYRQKNITVFDNTQSQIIDFDKEIEKYPNRKPDKVGRYISFRHCISVETCMRLIGKNFILMDSDILLLKDITELADDNFIYVGESEKQNYVDVYRVLPYICFINVKMCKKYGVTYFNENFMTCLDKDNTVGMKYDTGAYFRDVAQKYPYKEIHIGEYITHYKGGSWDHNRPQNVAVHGTLSPEMWCMKNKELWKTKQSDKVIYRCITGTYEPLTDLSYVNLDYDYICFSDNVNYDGYLWEIRPIPSELKTLSNVKQQRVIKILPHKYLSEYKFSIWIDGNIDIRGDVDVYISNNLTNPSKCVYMPEHPIRDCLYQEAIACIQRKKDTQENIENHLKPYRDEGYPAHNGMVQSGIIFRKQREPYCIELMEMWAKELINGSHRDQMSFNYCLWKIGEKGFGYLNKSIFKNEYFLLTPHVKTSTQPTVGSRVSYDQTMYRAKTFILECGYPWYTTKYEEVFSHVGDIEVVQCANGRYSNGYKKIIESINNREYKYIIVIHSNVNMFGNQRFGDEIVRRIKNMIKKDRDFGIYSPSFDYTSGLNNPSIRKHREGERHVDVVSDLMFVLNTNYCMDLPMYDFSYSPSGRGFIEALCDVVSKNRGAIIVDDGVYVSTSYVRSYSQDILDQHKRAFIRCNTKRE